MQNTLLVALVLILLVIITVVYLGTGAEKLASPTLKISFQTIPDLGNQVLYNKNIITIYDDMSSSRVVIHGNGTVLESENYSPDISKWWAAMRIMNFPFEKVNPCPSGPTNYILEFGGQKISVGCAPMHLYNDLASLTSS